MAGLGLIDWRLVGFAALWITGLSVVLAALSFADYTASQEGWRTRAVLGRPVYQLALDVGLLLFCLGLAGSARAAWELLLWVALAMVFAYQGWAAWRQRSG